MLIGEAIKSEFALDEIHSIEHAPEDAEFGYRSAHYVVRLNTNRMDLVEWNGLAGFRAEIQVRTVLQHAWAAISHKLQYKRENDIPKSLRRKLFRLSALFELADDEFVSLRDASGKLMEQIDAQIATGKRDIPIDHISLSQFINQSSTVSKLSEIAAEIGFKFDNSKSNDINSISDFIQLVSHTQIANLSEMELTLTDSLPWAHKYLKEQFDSCINTGSESWRVDNVFICMLILVRSQINYLKLKALYEMGWNHEIAARVFKIAESFKPR